MDRIRPGSLRGGPLPADRRRVDRLRGIRLREGPLRVKYSLGARRRASWRGGTNRFARGGAGLPIDRMHSTRAQPNTPRDLAVMRRRPNGFAMGRAFSRAVGFAVCRVQGHPNGFAMSRAHGYPAGHAMCRPRGRQIGFASSRSRDPIVACSRRT